MSVPTRTETLDELYTTTLNNRKKKEVDQIFSATPLYYWLKKRNKLKFDGDGGRYLEVPLAYAKNDTVTSLSKGDTISISDTSFLTTAQYEWKFVAGSIVRYFTDDAKNKSKQQHINLLNAKIENLRMSLIDKFEGYLFADGTGNSSKDPEGLGNIVSASPTSSLTVGNINQLHSSLWRATFITTTQSNTNVIGTSVKVSTPLTLTGYFPSMNGFPYIHHCPDNT